MGWGSKLLCVSFVGTPGVLSEDAKGATVCVIWYIAYSLDGAERATGLTPWTELRGHKSHHRVPGVSVDPLERTEGCELFFRVCITVLDFERAQKGSKNLTSKKNNVQTLIIHSFKVKGQWQTDQKNQKPGRNEIYCKILLEKGQSLCHHALNWLGLCSYRQCLCDYGQAKKNIVQSSDHWSKHSRNLKTSFYHRHAQSPAHTHSTCETPCHSAHRPSHTPLFLVFWTCSYLQYGKTVTLHHKKVSIIRT